MQRKLEECIILDILASMKNWEYLYWFNLRIETSKKFIPNAETSSSRNMIARTYRLVLVTIIIIVLYLSIRYYSAERLPLQVPVVSYLPMGPPIINCAEFELYATKVGAGMGNVIFELMSMLGLAAQTHRIPYIKDFKTNTSATKVLERFPKLYQYIRNIQQGATCLKPSEEFKLNTKCCSYLNTTDELIESKAATVRVKGAYLQSFKYFESMTKIIRTLLQSKREITSIAQQNLFPTITYNSSTKICVHIRRGDFVRVTNVLATRKDFTRASIAYVRGNDTNATVYIMSNDQQWSKRILDGISNIFFATTDPDWPPNVEWEFSRLFCDKVILTASASTYGWWMGFLSKGQLVYYNGKYSTPGGIEKELTETDFFPPHWKRIDLEGNGAISTSKNNLINK